MPEVVECTFCGGPCKVPSWAKDGSWYSNNPGKYAAAVANNHKWFTRSWLADVAKVVAATRAMVLAPSYPCAECGKHAFPAPGTVCFWCR